MLWPLTKCPAFSPSAILKNLRNMVCRRMNRLLPLDIPTQKPVEICRSALRNMPGFVMHGKWAVNNIFLIRLFSSLLAFEGRALCMSNKSITAIQDCMSALDLHPSVKPSYDLDADLFNKKNMASGVIGVRFNCNWHSGEGPYLEMDDEIKGFGIFYTQFKPRWQDISWDEATYTLTVKGQNYEFTLCFSS